jgi:hypothetical protein
MAVEILDELCAGAMIVALSAGADIFPSSRGHKCEDAQPVRQTASRNRSSQNLWHLPQPDFSQPDGKSPLTATSLSPTLWDQIETP